MEEQFVTYEIAVQLKELGFDEECFAYFNGKYIDFKIDNFDGAECYQINTTKNIGLCINAPLWQQAIDWLRIRYCILIHPFYHGRYEYKVESSIETASSGVIVDGENWNDVREKAVLKALEVIEKNKTK